MTYHLSMYFQQMTQKQLLSLKQSRQKLYICKSHKLLNLSLQNFELIGYHILLNCQCFFPWEADCRECNTIYLLRSLCQSNLKCYCHSSFVLTTILSKCRKWHLRELRLQNFPGGRGPTAVPIQSLFPLSPMFGTQGILSGSEMDSNKRLWA